MVKRNRSMNKLIRIIVCMLLVLLTAGCRGNVSDVKVLEYKSDIYSEEEIEEAIEVVKKCFRLEFSGCTLTEITYAGDDKISSYEDWATRNDGDEVIVLISSFDVDASGGDGSLNPNSTYSNWSWILVRKNGENWQHVDHGY